MLEFNLSEMAVVAVVALLVIGPKDLPKAMRFVGHWVGRARGVARQFRSGFDAMVREAELEEMEKKWAAENERIMREYPSPPADTKVDDVAAERDADAYLDSRIDRQPDAQVEHGAETGADPRSDRAPDDMAERVEQDAGGPPPQMTPRP